MALGNSRWSVRHAYDTESPINDTALEPRYNLIFPLSGVSVVCSIERLRRYTRNRPVVNESAKLEVRGHRRSVPFSAVVDKTVSRHRRVA